MADDADKKALDTAIELTKQLIALATGIITVMAALLGIFKSVPAVLVPALASSVYFEVLSVVFGLFVFGAITARLDKTKKFDVAYHYSVRYLAIAQWIFFAAGLVFLSLSFIQLR